MLFPAQSQESESTVPSEVPGYLLPFAKHHRLFRCELGRGIQLH
jgi:hypothetical protein